MHVERRAHVRYAGTQAALEVPLGPGVRDDFTAAHRTRFGFATPERPLVVEAVAVEAIAPGERVAEPALAARTRGRTRAGGHGRRSGPAAPSMPPRCSSARPCWPATASPARR